MKDTHVESLKPPSAGRSLAPVLIALLLLGAVVSIKVVPSIFIVDELNYLINITALRDGRVTVGNTAALSPSRELLFFDPGPQDRLVDHTPVASNAPPLYAPLALPFSWFGWRGLVALNTIAYLLTGLIIFIYSRRAALDPSTPWLALGAFALGGYAFEYAQGLWPHALSVLLCTTGILVTGRVAAGGRLFLAAGAGLALGVAAGVRYQNAVVVVVCGAAVLVWSSRRWRATGLFVAGAMGPLIASALINHGRLGSWNPISKGPGYLKLPAADSLRNGGWWGVWSDASAMFWGQFVDYSYRPPLVGPLIESWLKYDPETGATLIVGLTVKKAFLQSAPWAILGVVGVVLAWLPARGADVRTRDLRLFAVIAAVTVAVFSFAGVARHDGLAFNQRYLLELLPLAAIACAWTLDGLKVKPSEVAVGVAGGIVLVLVILFATPVVGEPNHRLWQWRQILLMKTPLVLSLTCWITWHLAVTRSRARAGLAVALGLCLGWGMALHLADDVFRAQSMRERHLARTQAFASVLTDGSALVAYWSSGNPVGPLLLRRDIVVLDAHADDGRDAEMLIRELIGRGRRTFVWTQGFPPALLTAVTNRFEVTRIEGHDGLFLELK